MRYLLLLGLLLLPFKVRAYSGYEASADTATVKVAGLIVNETSLLITAQPDRVYAIMDAFPYRGAVKALGSSFTWKIFAAALAREVVFPRYASATAALIDVVEYPERDDYGAPLWTKLVRLGHFVAVKRHGIVTVEEKPLESK